MDRHERMTLVVRSDDSFWHAWSEDLAEVPLRFVPSLHEALGALSASVQGSGPEIESVVIDRAGTADAILDLLGSLPAEFTGDVLYIRRDHSGLVSATVRGGGRLIYALRPDDVQFYLDARGVLPGASVAGIALRAIA